VGSVPRTRSLDLQEGKIHHKGSRSRQERRLSKEKDPHRVEVAGVLNLAQLGEKRGVFKITEQRDPLQESVVVGFGRGVVHTAIW